MKSLWVCADGAGASKLQSLPLPFMFFGATVTDADRALMPPPEVARAYSSVSLARRVDLDGARRLLVVVSGSVTVTTAYMRATLCRGDALFVDAGDGRFDIETAGDCRLVRLEVAQGWTPDGVVPPTIDEDGAERTVLVQHMYVHDDQARFRGADAMFDDSTSRPVMRAMFTCLSPDQFGGWHTEEATSLVVVLAGGFEMEVGGGGGAAHVFRAGDVCLVQDHTGQGHISRTHGETRFLAIAVPEEHVWSTR